MSMIGCHLHENDGIKVDAFVSFCTVGRKCRMASRIGNTVHVWR